MEKYCVKLAFGNDAVAQHNYQKLLRLSCPIIRIKARHNNSKGSKLSADEFGGLEPMICICEGARVMLTRNLWTEKGLCNGTMGIVKEIIFKDGDFPPALPLAIVVQFDSYTGPQFRPIFDKSHMNFVPVAPVTSQSDIHGSEFERQQFPLKLSYAITIHKSQGLTIDKAWIDLGPTEKASGITYVAISRVRSLEDLVIEPMSYERLVALTKSITFAYRCKEEKRLEDLNDRQWEYLDDPVSEESVLRLLHMLD